MQILGFFLLLQWPLTSLHVYFNNDVWSNLFSQAKITQFLNFRHRRRFFSTFSPASVNLSIAFSETISFHVNCQHSRNSSSFIFSKTPASRRKQFAEKNRCRCASRSRKESVEIFFVSLDERIGVWRAPGTWSFGVQLPAPRKNMKTNEISHWEVFFLFLESDDVFRGIRRARPLVWFFSKKVKVISASRFFVLSSRPTSTTLTNRFVFTNVTLRRQSGVECVLLCFHSRWDFCFLSAQTNFSRR